MYRQVRWLVVIATCVGFQAAVGSSPSGPAVSLDKFQHVWSTNEMVLLGLGDSITAGFGATKKHSYFELLVENDDTAYPDMKGRELRKVLPNLRTTNCSVSSTISEQHLNIQVARLNPFPDSVHGIVVITTGGNDLIHDYGRSTPRDGAMYGCTLKQAQAWSKLFEGRLAAIISRIRERFPGGCDVFLANIYDPTDGVGDIEHAPVKLPRWPDGLRALALFNEVIAAQSSQNPSVHLVDLRASFLGHGIHHRDRGNKHYSKSDPSYWYFDNLEDPNDRGYDAIRRLFLIEMGKVFDRK